MMSPIDSFGEHPFAFLWRHDPPASADEAVGAMLKVQQMVADLIVENEANPAPRSTLDCLFMPYHQNGTFNIGVRLTKTIPPFLRGESGDLATWIRTATRSDLVRMLYARVLPPHFRSEQIETVAAVVSDVFSYRGSTGWLYDQIPNQNYIDYIRRAIALYVYKDPNVEFDTEAEYNEFATEAALGIIHKLQQSYGASSADLPRLRQLMVYSILAGIIALDMKCSHCAASSLTADNLAASQGDSASGRVDAIYGWLRDKANNPRLFCNELFAWEAYVEKVLSGPCKMFFFADDLGETLLDLFRLQSELTFNPGLQVVFIPRNGRFHNDCALADVYEILEQRCLEDLKRLQDQGRFVVNANGPKNGSVEAPKMNRDLVESILDDADILFFKGSRSYEMIATGIRIPTFSGQTVSRDFSESVTGASSATGVPVLRFFHAFPDYWGFTERHRRIEPLFPTGALGWLARMTAIDSARFTASPLFKRACARRAVEDVASEIMARAERALIPPHHVHVS